MKSKNYEVPHYEFFVFSYVQFFFGTSFSSILLATADQVPNLQTATDKIPQGKAMRCDAVSSFHGYKSEHQCGQRSVHSEGEDTR
jgi:hypothetical protein